MAKPTLFLFHWRQAAASGEKQGQVFAYTERDARQELANQSIVPSRLIRRRLSSFQQRRHKAKAADITQFSRDLTTLLESGIPIVQALNLIALNQVKAEMRLLVRHIRQQLEAGTNLSDALAHASPLFDRFYCDLVATGEQTGQLPEIFARLTLYREKQALLRSKVIKAMIYPTIVISVALGVSAYLLVFVIPKFKHIFDSFGAELPWLTQQVLALSDIVSQHALTMTVVVAGLAAAHQLLQRKNATYRYHYDRWLLKFPVIGEVIGKACIAKFSRTLATTFSAGIPLLSGLQAATKSMTNAYYVHALNGVYQHTATGIPLYQALRDSNSFPVMVTQMVMIGEESGSLDDMLNRIAQIYGAEVDNTVDNLGKIIEPLLILVLGLLIGGLVVAMYLPIFNLMSVLG
ncbi:type II secretion system protein F [Salinivibrio siamensis]|uniref:Type II secretion system protein F n=1 Tax=Salinivibrio siamensis TaxID=414286 RepID=A0ABX3KG08_9GAMM|nr:type II secretion system F family protein [Salinivibrio siamensis]OOE87900.1 type II secretion system protein F [Salinivibrio siamensis]